MTGLLPKACLAALLALSGCGLLHRDAATARPPAAAATPAAAQPAAPQAAAAPAAAPAAMPPPAAGPAAAPGPAAGPDMAAMSDSYIIGPGDKLSVFVYDSPQLSADVPVRPDGRIATPLVQDMVAAGKTPAQLAREIAAQLKEYIKDPRVTIMVREFVGPLDRGIRVIGEAAEPLALPYREHMTVLDVMIASKGLTRFAAGNRAIILRRSYDKSGAEHQETIHVRLSDLMKDGDIEQNVAMQPGDTLIIPQSWF
jgi:polysaccharide export outer membrane protein